LRTQYGGDAPVCQDLPDRRQYQEAAGKPRLVDRFADVSVGEILEQAIGVEPGRWTKSDQMRVGAYQCVPVGTIKRFIAGKGNADKAAVIEAVRARGYHPADDNEADAIAILLWALETRGGVR